MTTATAAPPAGLEQRYLLRPDDFERVRRLIHERAGISLQAGKEAMVTSRLARRLRETGQHSFHDYLEALARSSGGAAEWQMFINCLTTHLTSFFREEHHFHALVHELRARAGPALRLWCNAASTGEEPYSLAMVVSETLGSTAAVQLLCSDIDTQVLATAQRGVYGADARGLSPHRMRRFFLRGTGAHAGMIRVKPELARAIEFRSFNLATPNWAGLGEPFDIVFCRNVMIYFDAGTQRRVLERIHATTRRGALLFAGHSESFSESRDLFRLRGKTIYERIGRD